MVPIANNNGLTSFRFFAFLAVFLFHNLVFPVGYLGVQAFFVLSGYLITAILCEMKDVCSTREYFISFYIRRTLRIFPVYYFYLLMIVVLALPFYFPNSRSDLSVINRFYHQLPWALTYTYNFFHASDFFKHTFLLTHFWSLAIEEQFYLVWPIALYLIPKKYLRTFLLIVVFSGPLVRWITGFLVSQHTFAFLGHDTGLVVYVLPFSHFDAFALGGFYALYGKGTSPGKISLLCGLIILLGLVTSYCFESEVDWAGLGYSDFMRGSYKYVWGYSLFNLFCVLILATIRDKKYSIPLLENKILVYLGTISYGLYIFHNAFIWLINLYLPEVPSLLKLCLIFLLTVLMAAISYSLLEKPCLKLKDRFAPSPRL